MTQTIQKLIEALEELPEAEQEECATSYLGDLQRRKHAGDEPGAIGDDNASKAMTTLKGGDR